MTYNIIVANQVSGKEGKRSVIFISERIRKTEEKERKKTEWGVSAYFEIMKKKEEEEGNKKEKCKTAIIDRYKKKKKIKCPAGLK